jgi:rare lipoprotein A (peptidoglycan hydrolase)
LSCLTATTSFGKKGIETKTLPVQGEVFDAVSSWYGYEMGKFTANGEHFNPMALTVAHRRLPFNTKLRLINPDNGKVIYVRVTDRGPFVKRHGYYFRDLDVSEGCAIALGFHRKGVTHLVAEVLEYGQPKVRKRFFNVHRFVLHTYKFPNLPHGVIEHAWVCTAVKLQPYYACKYVALR